MSTKSVIELKKRDNHVIISSSSQLGENIRGHCQHTKGIGSGRCVKAKFRCNCTMYFMLYLLNTKDNEF